jgi:hypothetical protein
MMKVLSPLNNPCEAVPIGLFATIIWYLNGMSAYPLSLTIDHHVEL